MTVGQLVVSQFGLVVWTTAVQPELHALIFGFRSNLDASG
jgi:hypothetical protein